MGAARKGAALPAPARKLADSATERTSSGLPGWLLERGYTPFPREFFRRVAPRLSHAALLCVGIVYEETIGKPRRTGARAPEWAHLKESDFARWTGLSERGVRKALDEAETCVGDQIGLIRSKPVGRSRAYQVAYEHLDALPARKPRTLEDAEDAPPAPPPPIPAQLACPLGHVCPVTSLVRVNGHMTIAPAEGEDKAKPPTAKKRCTETGTAVPVSEPQVADSATGRIEPLSPEFRPASTLRQMLEAKLARQLHSCVDAPMFARITRALGPAPPEDLAAAIDLKAARIRSWGMVELIARDCAQAWAKVGYRQSLIDLERKLAEASGEDLVTLARELLKHPDLPDWKRDDLLRAFPGLHYDRYQRGVNA